MKYFFNNLFKYYLFPIIVVFLGAYLQTGENVSSVSDFFSESTIGFFRFFSRQLYLWEVLLYFLIVTLLFLIYKTLFKRRSKKEKAMLKAIKNIPHQHEATISSTNYKYLFKFNPTVIDEEYFIDNLRPYCMNCSLTPLRMSEYGGGNFICGCGRKVNYRLARDVESRIITSLENKE